jgi:hypothetical protein
VTPRMLRLGWLILAAQVTVLLANLAAFTIWCKASYLLGAVLVGVGAYFHFRYVRRFSL